MTRIGTATQAIEVHDLPDHLSYSQLAMIEPHFRYACARKWGYKYRLRLPEERTPALAMGAAFDEAANCYFTMRMEGASRFQAARSAGDIGVANLHVEIPDIWGTHTLDEYESMFVTAFALFLEEEGERQVALVQDKHRFTIQVERDFTLPVVGYSDRIDRDGTIVDHKFSGSPRWDQEGTWHEDWLGEKRTQLLLYWLARNAEEKRTGQALSPPLTGLGRVVVIYHRLGLLHPQIRSAEVSLSLDDAWELLDMLASAARTIRDDKLPARPGQACRFCSFLGRCRDDEVARGRGFFDLCGVPF